MSKEIKQSPLNRFKGSYSYKKLIQEHRLDEIGIWKVRGEDPNCDFGGHHYMPELATFEGKLEDVIAHAVTLSGFWQWGAGGDIQKVGKPIKIDANSSAARTAAQQKVNELEALLAKARNELESL
jgi:hypothetical protein